MLIYHRASKVNHLLLLKCSMKDVYSSKQIGLAFVECAKQSGKLASYSRYKRSALNEREEHTFGPESCHIWPFLLIKESGPTELPPVQIR